MKNKLLYFLILCFLLLTACSSGAEQTDKNNDVEIIAASGDEVQTTLSLEEERQLEIDKIIHHAESLARGYFYYEAIWYLENSQFKEDAEIIAKAKEFTNKLDNLELYQGKIYHVFFHSLILDNEKAFDNVGHSAQGYNMWMTTQSEFKKMLPELLKNDYILYSISELITTDENGNTQPKPIYLPTGKKPLIISVDDVSYYDYMKGDGFANRLVVNDKGEVVTEVIKADGSVEYTYDGDVMPILDQFVKEHPEFSYRGAKGIVAPTGYQGIFGYRISDLEQYTPEQVAQMEKDVKAVVKALKESGWEMATHSYTHNNYFRDASITMWQLQSEVQRWKAKITPYIGETNIFISPFGMHLNSGDARLAYLVSEGFTIYCPVGGNMRTRYYDGAMVQERLNLDGYTFAKFPERCDIFFDVDKIFDTTRPPLEVK